MSWQEFCMQNKVGRFADVHISACDKLDPSIVKQGIDWCKNPRSLLIHGDIGRGKTHFTFCLVREAIHRFGMYAVRWERSKTLDDKLLAAFEKYRDCSDIIQSFSECKVLFIDDFGVERTGERTERDYFHIIDARWVNNLPTIITTNLSSQQIEKTYGARIHSRMKDYRWIHFQGVDLRGGG